MRETKKELAAPLSGQIQPGGYVQAVSTIVCAKEEVSAGFDSESCGVVLAGAFAQRQAENCGAVSGIKSVGP